MKIRITVELSEYDRMAVAKRINSDATKPATRDECKQEIESVIFSHFETLRFDAYGADGDDGKSEGD
jgi:hypothetical protein